MYAGNLSRLKQESHTDERRFRINPNFVRIWFLSFFINNPHAAINSHHTIRHGNFHNFHFPFLFYFCYIFSNRNMNEKAVDFPIERRFSIRKLLSLLLQQIGFLQFNVVANTFYWLEFYFWHCSLCSIGKAIFQLFTLNQNVSFNGFSNFPVVLILIKFYFFFSPFSRASE